MVQYISICKFTLHLLVILLTSHGIPGQVDAGGLLAQVTKIRPVAFSASTCPGKHVELQPDSKHLNVFPEFHCT